MTNRELVEYLYTQDPDAEVTVFDGYNALQIDDICDTQLQVSIRGDEEN